MKAKILLSFSLLLGICGNCQTDIILNGGFESGLANWNYSSKWSIHTLNPCVGGSFTNTTDVGGYAYPDLSMESLYQNVSIPSNTISATLNFCYKINTDDPGSGVTMQAWFGSSPLATYDFASSNNNWQSISMPISDISNYLGQSINVTFIANESSGNSYWGKVYVDDVSLLITSGSSCTSPTATVNDNTGTGSVTMYCTATGGSGGSILYKWYSGNSCSGAEIGYSSTYTTNTPGYYACKAYIDGYEFTCEDCGVGYATVNTSGTAPTVSFTVSQSTILQGETITTMNNSTGNPTPTYVWSASPSSGVTFSPSNTATNPSITFINIGTFTVSLTATNSNGTDQANTTITVNSNGTSQNYDWIWARRAGGTSIDNGYSSTTDANGNILVTGSFRSSSITFGTTTLTNAGGGYEDMFIVKYDASGNVLWAKRAGGTNYDYGYSSTTDASGNILVTGSFASSSITFGSTTLTNASAGNADIFIVKYDPNGNVLWAKSAGGNPGDSGGSVATDANGNIFVTGRFNSYSITFGTTTLTNANFGSGDMFIVKYNGNGNALWAKSAGGNDNDEGRSVAADANGNILVIGIFGSSSITFGSTTLTNAGSYDIFIVKYDPNGNVLWAKRAGGTSQDHVQSCSTDGSGNIIATGYFSSASITFGSTTLTNASADTADIFIVKYDPNGNVLWAKRADGGDFDYGESCSTDGSGNIIATGTFVSASITFGTTTLTNANSSYSDMFIVKYDPSGNILWAKSAGGTYDDYGNSVATDANGNIFVTGNFVGSSITFGTTTLTNAGSDDMFIAKLGIATTSIWENTAYEKTFTVYPNPTLESFTLSFDNLKSENIYVNIFNVLGEVIFFSQSETAIGKYQQEINLGNVPQGVYFIQTIMGEKTYMNKILKQ